MFYLTLGLLALAAGPLLYQVAGTRRFMLSALDGFNFVAIAGLVLAHILPAAYDKASWFAIGIAILGFLGPALLERFLHRTAEKAHIAALVVAVAGLAVHDMLDGAALGSGDRNLAWAVILHRPMVSATLWMLLQRRVSRPFVWAILGGMGLATLGGYHLGAVALHGHAYGLAVFEALVAGSLLHVVIHSPSLGMHNHARESGAASAFGALAAVALLWGITLLEHDPLLFGVATGDALARGFWLFTLESAPALVLAYAGAGLLEGFMPRATVSWMGKGGPGLQALKGVGFGLPLPICSCGVVPLYQGLVQSGTPPSAAMSFIVAAPEVGIDAALLSMSLLGGPLTAARIACAMVIATMAGWAIGRRIPWHPVSPEHATSAPRSNWRERLRHSLRAGFLEVVDNTAPWILFGLGLAALGTNFLDPRYLRGLAGGWDVPLLALLGIPTYVCATGSTPLAALFIAKGISPGAAMAFLLTGPATNATTFGMLSRLHGRRIAVSFGMLVIGLAVGLGYLVNAFIPHPTVFTPDAANYEHVGWLQYGCAAAVAVLYFASFLRQGVRRFAGHILDMAHSDRHDNHDHEAENGHEDCCTQLRQELRSEPRSRRDE